MKDKRYNEENLNKSRKPCLRLRGPDGWSGKTVKR